MPHPDYLLEILTPRQIDDWAAFNELEPIGTYSQDLVVGQVTATIVDAMAAMGGNKDHEPSDPRTWIWYARKEVRDLKKRKEGEADSGWLKNAFGVSD